MITNTKSELQLTHDALGGVGDVDTHHAMNPVASAEPPIAAAVMSRASRRKFRTLAADVLTRVTRGLASTAWSTAAILSDRI